MKGIDKIIKSKKLTGEEIGQIMLRDLYVEWKHASEDPDVANGLKEATGLLNDAQRSALVDGLTKREDIVTYNNYKAMYEHCTRDTLSIGIRQQLADVNALKLMQYLKKIEYAEQANFDAQFDPIIMTQQQYDEIKQKHKEESLRITESPESLIIHALNFYITKYKTGEATPFDKYFEAAKIDLLSNPRIKANYWEEGHSGYRVLPDGRTSKDMSEEEWKKEVMNYSPSKYGKIPNRLDEIIWVEDPSAPEDATKFNVLEYVSGFYFSAETESKETFKEFESDYPELYNALISHLCKMNGLSFLKDITGEDMFNNSLIKWSDLYANNILDYPNTIESLPQSPKIAVLMNSYNAGVIHRGKSAIQYISADTIIENEEYIKNMLESIVNNLREAQIIKTVFDLFSDYVKVPELKEMSDQINYTIIDMLNSTMENIIDYIIRYGSDPLKRTQEEIEETRNLRAAVREILIPIDHKQFVFKKEALHELEKNINFESLTARNLEPLYRILRERG